MTDQIGWYRWELEDAPEVDEFLASARRQLAGDRTPLGAASLFRLLTRWNQGTDSDTDAFVDEWVSDGGLGFAVEAVLEAADLRVGEVEVSWDELTSATPQTRHVWSVVRLSSDPEPDPATMQPPTHVMKTGLVRDAGAEHLGFHGSWKQMLIRLRGLLATAPADQYATAMAVASGMRENTPRRAVATFLFPTEQDWADEVFDDDSLFTWHFSDALLVSVSRLEHATRALSVGRASDGWVSDPARLAAVYDGLGTDIVPLLKAEFASPVTYREDKDAQRQAIVDLLVRIPSDSAFAALAHCAQTRGYRQALLDAMGTYPRRAFRLLPDVSPAIFDRHVRAHPELRRAVYDELPVAVRHRIDALEQAAPLAEKLPGVLADPPWTRRGRSTALPVVTGLKAPDISKVRWLPGELEEIQNRPHEYSYTTWEDYKRWVPRTSPDSVTEHAAPAIFLLAPDDIARPMLERWNGRSLKSPARVLARFGLDSVPLMLRLARARPGAAAPYLLPVIDLDVARLQATAFATRKNLRAPALEWMVRHAEDAVVLLVPDALDKPSPMRDHAIAALLGLAGQRSVDDLVGMAEPYGSAATTALRTILTQDPLDILPKRIPRIPDWVEVDTLPPVLTRGRDARLPSPALAHVLTMCAIGKAGSPYPGLADVIEFCDRRSLATMAWEVFDRWWGADAPSKDNWALLALGWLGDDRTVTALAPLIRTWPGENGTARAQLGLDALAAIGTGKALTELSDMARRMKFKSLKAGAARRVDEVADSLGLDHDQLGDRIVPDLGLSAAGTMTLSYGSREFTVGFDEALVPYVTDPAGKKTKSLPKPSATDDPALADESKAQFTELKRDAKAVATEQIKRLNRAMVIGRRWTHAEFDELLLNHPLLIHVCRRLLWASFTAEGDPEVVFRIAEDNTYADVHDEEVTVSGDRIGLIHPAHIPETIAAWSSLFADYEILQPFAQLGRPVHVPETQDIDGTGLRRFTGVTATASQALRLTYRGWEPVWENPGNTWGQGLQYTLSSSVSVLLGLDPGMGVGSPYEGYPDQKLVCVELRGGTLDDIDAATASELLADLSGFAS